MAPGPTQNYDDATLGRWEPHPVLAALVRGVLLTAPVVFTVAFGLAATRWAGPARLGLHPWVWLPGEVALATVLLVGSTRLLGRLMPLTTLLRLSLFFPAAAPSRLAMTVRSCVRRTRLAGLDLGAAGGRRAVGRQTALLTALVTLLGEHDRRTQEHSRRVQVYATLIAQQMGLSDDATARLGWAALLHDVGKVHVPVDILNHAALPSAEQWDVLAQHPAQGAALVAPLADWLDGWVAAVGEHHERWDGGGYPRGLAGTNISLAGRIVAVADAFDVITTARPYKRPLSAAAAREELARCAGTQFDPEVVRAFLAVGLRPIRRVAGPAALLAGLPGLGVVPLPSSTSLGAVTAGALGTAGATVVAAAVGAVLTVVAPAAGTIGTLGAAAAAERPGLDAPGASVEGAAASAQGSGAGRASDGAPADDAADDATGAGAPSAGGASAGGPAAASASAPLATGGDGTTDLDGRADGAPAAVSDGPAAAAPGGPAPDGVPRDAPAVPAGADPPAATASPCVRASAGQVDLAGADLSGCDLRGVTLDGARLAGATLEGVDLTGARLHGADLSGAVLTGVRADDVYLGGANLTGARISDSSFVRADLTGARVEDVVVRRTSFAGASFVAAGLARTDLTGTDLSGADLTRARASGAVLSDADLHGAVTTLATLQSAVLRGSRLDGTDLTRADLRHADLTGATGSPAAVTAVRWLETVCPSGSLTSTGCF